MKTNQSNNKQQKRKIGIGLFVLSLFLLITGTFAWRDYRQHKSNVMSGKGLSRDVVLVEQYDPKDGEDWSKSDPTIDKKVSVKNKGEGNAIVRLSLKEYMELVDGDSKTSQLRYMIDEQGNYVKVAAKDLGDNPTSEAIVESFKNSPEFGQFVSKLDGFDSYTVATESDNDSNPSFRFHKLKGSSSEDEELYYYIATQAKDPNGQYGKHISFGNHDIDFGVEPLSGSIITGGGENKDTRPNAHDNHHNETSDVCDLFEVINEDRPNQIAKEHAAKYIDIDYNKDYYDGNYDDTKEYTEGKWVLHGDYFYYSTVLKPDTSTENILESLTLKIQPDTGFIYQMHIDLEAVSFDEISDGFWDDTNVENDIPKIFENWENDEAENIGQDQDVPALPDTADKVVGDTINIDGLEFIILHKDKKGRALVQTRRNLPNAPAITFYSGSSTKFQGFRESNPQNAIKNWYDNIKDDESKASILSYKIKDEDNMIENAVKGGSYRDENRFYSFPDSGGEKGAFMLGVSDITKYLVEENSDEPMFIGATEENVYVYNMSETAKKLIRCVGKNPYWLRTPAAHIREDLNAVAFIGDSQMNVADLPTTKPICGARPALWIQLEK